MKTFPWKESFAQTFYLKILLSNFPKLQIHDFCLDAAKDGGGALQSFRDLVENVIGDDR